MEIWGGKDGPSEFVEFIYKQIVPACFLAPLRETFDLNDAQTTLALSESALCLRAILEKRVRNLDLGKNNNVLLNSVITMFFSPGRRRTGYVSSGAVLANA